MKVNYIWPFEGQSNAYVTLCENVFDTPGVEAQSQSQTWSAPHMLRQQLNKKHL